MSDVPTLLIGMIGGAALMDGVNGLRKTWQHKLGVVIACSVGRGMKQLEYAPNCQWRCTWPLASGKYRGRLVMELETDQAGQPFEEKPHDPDNRDMR